MRVVRGRRAVTLWACVLLPACAQQGQSLEISAERGSLVQVDVAYTRDLAPGADDRLEAEAHFLRYHAADHRVNRTVVASLLGLGDDASIVLDSCQNDDRLDELSRSSVAQGAGAVEVTLLDAGPLLLRARSGDVATPLTDLAPQRYPELFPFVSGVVYGQEATPAPALEPGAALEIEAQGGEDVGPFLAAGGVPAAFPDLVATRDAASGELRLDWAPLSGDVLVDVRWSGTQAGAMRCRARDDGHFTIAATALSALDAALAAGEKAQVSVARSERAPLEAPGLGQGTLSITLRDTLPLDQGVQ
jgi:hypothetical protein